MRRFAGMRASEVWYTRLDAERFRALVDADDHKYLDRAMARARRKDSLRALAQFAGRYADQNERDHAALAQAVADGRLEAVSDR
jgi:hypothetical protein